MKNLLKVAVVAVLSLGFGVAANAQDAVTNVTNTTMNAEAKVLAALVLTAEQTVNLGNLSSSTPGDIVLDPKGVSNGNTGTSAEQGIFKLTANAGSSVKFGWPKSIELLEATDPSKKMVFTLNVFGGATEVAANSALMTTVSAGTNWEADASVAASGLYYLFVGGSIPKLTGQTTGDYSGSALFTVEYN